MPYEVKPIEGTRSNSNERVLPIQSRRSPENVAADIAAFYDRMKEVGGQVIAGYTVSEQSVVKTSGGYDESRIDRSFLYLVGQTPDEQTSDQ
jgi:hypothetical protein